MYKTNTTVAFFLLRLLLLLLLGTTRTEQRTTLTCCSRATATTRTTAFIRVPPAVSSSSRNYPWRRSRTMTQLFNIGGGWWWSGSTNGGTYGGGGLHTATIQEFAGKNVLITGASSGLGRSLALQLAQYGQIHTLLLSARSVTTLQEVAQECYALQAMQASQTGPSHHSSLTIHILPADLADPESVQQLAQQALDHCRKSSSTDNSSSSNDNNSNSTSDDNNTHKTNTGRIDVLINNGGVSSRSRFVDTSIAIDQQILQINFLAGAALAKMLVQQHYQYVDDPSNNDDNNDDHTNNNNNDGIPTTRSTRPTTPPDRTSRATRGRIIWISSVQGKIGIPHRSSYAASKFAVQGYCECIRSELYTDGILVHCISPGYIQTNLSRSALTGTGQRHGQLDVTTAQGQSPHVVATTILNQVVVRRDMDGMVASNWSATIAIAMRWWCPRFLQQLLVRRYQKSIGVIVMNTTTTTTTTNRIPATNNNYDDNKME
jgi:dehydrogenase/reductase SDR family member 7B